MIMKLTIILDIAIYNFVTSVILILVYSNRKSILI